jgi:hypothetical protein
MRPKIKKYLSQVSICDYFHRRKKDCFTALAMMDEIRFMEDGTEELRTQ